MKKAAETSLPPFHPAVATVEVFVAVLYGVGAIGLSWSPALGALRSGSVAVQATTACLAILLMLCAAAVGWMLVAGESLNRPPSRVAIWLARRLAEPAEEAVAGAGTGTQARQARDADQSHRWAELAVLTRYFASL